MKSISEIKAGLLNGKTLSTSQMSLVKGGLDAPSVVFDDKRRERPGGGVTTI